MISRTPILTSLPVTGQYRYRDVLQIIPSRMDDPRPATVQGWYGATLAVAFDEKGAPERIEDRWAHDHRERARFEFLKSRLQEGIGSAGWLQQATHTQTEFYRRPAIEHEGLRLLQAFTWNAFRKPSMHEKDWYLEPGTCKAVFAQGWYPSFVTEQWGEFWDGPADSIPTVNSSLHFERVGIGPEDKVLTLPQNLEANLTTYFSLAAEHKIKFARACELYGNAQEIWSKSRSLSLAAHVFAIDALCHIDDPRPLRCPDCHNLRSEQTCATCGGPRFGLTRRFRDFVRRYVPDDPGALSERLFSVRSAIAHTGELLRADEFDAGFNIGGADDQQQLLYGVQGLVRKVLLGWLADKASSALASSALIDRTST